MPANKIISLEERNRILNKKNRGSHVASSEREDLKLQRKNAVLHSYLMSVLPNSLKKRFALEPKAKNIWDSLTQMCSAHQARAIQDLYRSSHEAKIHGPTGAFAYIHEQKAAREQLRQLTKRSPDDARSISELERAVSGVPELHALYAATKSSLREDKDDYEMLSTAFLESITDSGLLASSSSSIFSSSSGPVPTASSSSGSAPSVNAMMMNDEDGPQCFHCGRYGHIRRSCPERINEEAKQRRDRERHRRSNSPRRSDSPRSNRPTREERYSIQRACNTPIPPARSRSRSVSPAKRPRSRSRSRSTSPPRKQYSNYYNTKNAGRTPGPEQEDEIAHGSHHHVGMIRIGSLRIPHSNRMMIDSGSELNLNNSKDHEDFHTFEEVKFEGTCANGTPLLIRGRGLIRLRITSGHEIDMYFHWAPALQCNVISTGALVGLGFSYQGDGPQETYTHREHGDQKIEFKRDTSGLCFANLRVIRRKRIAPPHIDTNDPRNFIIEITNDDAYDPYFDPNYVPPPRIMSLDSIIGPLPDYSDALDMPPLLPSFDGSKHEDLYVLSSFSPFSFSLLRKPDEERKGNNLKRVNFSPNLVVGPTPSLQRSGKRVSTIRVGQISDEDRAKIDHCLYGHLSARYLPPHSLPASIQWCSACRMTKTTRPSFTNTGHTRSDCMGQIYHSDLAGPFRPASMPRRDRYFSVFKDDYSKYIVVILHQDKKHVADAILYQLRNDANRFNRNPEAIYLDKGGEVGSQAFINALKEMGVSIHLAPTQLHERNGAAEGTINVIQRIARALLVQCRLPQCFWGYAVQMSALILNIIVRPGKKISAYEMKFQRSPPQIYPFGSRVTFFVVETQRQAGKLGNRACEGRYVGYDTTSNCHLVLPINSGRLQYKAIIVAELKCDEMSILEGNLLATTQEYKQQVPPPEENDPYRNAPLFLPALLPPTAAQDRVQRDSIESGAKVDDSAVLPAAEPAVEEQKGGEEVIPNPVVVAPTPSVESKNNPNIHIQDMDVIAPNAEQDMDMDQDHGVIAYNDEQPPENEVKEEEIDLSHVVPSAEEPELRRSTRVRSDNSRLRDFDVSSLPNTSFIQSLSVSKQSSKFETSTASSASSSGTSRFIPSYSQEQIDEEDRQELPNFKVVGHLDHWKKATLEEVDRLVKTGALVETDVRDLSEDEQKKIVTSTVALKRKSDGRFKARLCGRGFETDAFYEDAPPSWSPCPRQSTVRMMMVIIFAFTLKVFSADITQAYTCAEMLQTLFITPPSYPDLILLAPGLVWRVRRSLYGFRQAGHNWWRKLQHILLSLGYKQSTYDACLFFLPGTMSFILFYVDDLLIIGTDKQIETAVLGLQRALPNSVTGSHGLSKYLGFNIKDLGTHIIIHAAPYIQKCLNKFKIHGSSKIPWSSSLPPRDDATEDMTNQRLYRQLIGSLNWISTLLRPDISAIAHHLSSFSHNPTERHMTAAIQVFKYLKGTMNVGLKVIKNTSLSLIAYSDASLRRVGHEKATLASIILFCGTPICWFTRKMTTIATSVFHAELQAALDASQEIMFIRNLLSEISLSPGPPTPLYVDNTTTIDYATREGMSDKGRLLDHKFLRVRELVSEGHIRLIYVSSVENMADALSKPLNRPRLVLLRDRMFVCPF
jgi:hypothetical protein